MERDTEVTPVVFRVWRASEGGGVLALFPNESPSVISKPWLCDSYEHIGQHGSADYAGCVNATRPATETEAAPLKAELESLGYKLRVLKRRPAHA